MAKKKTAKKAAAKAAPKPKKPKGPKQTSFAAFVAKSQKTWPNTLQVASKLQKGLRLISTGNLGLDIAAYGGIPGGRVSRFYGKEKSAKTGSSLNTMQSWQVTHCGICYEAGPCPHGKVNGVDRPYAKGLWIDAENRMRDMWGWVEGHGVLLDHLLVQAPPSGQFIVDYVDAVIREKGTGIGLIVVDSIAHMTCEDELKKASLKGKTIGRNAQLVNLACRKWAAAINSLGVEERVHPTIIMINQLRMKTDGFGNPEVMPGGLGANYLTSLDIRFSRGKTHYLIPAAKGTGWEDKAQGTYGDRWKPDPDASADYAEINYRVTASGVCGVGRYGSFQYWCREAHGRRKGDPDNTGRLWEYARKLGLMEKEKTGYTMCGLQARTQLALKQQFFEDEAVQKIAWAKVVEELMT